MSQFNQWGYSQSGGRTEKNARKNEKKVLLDIVSYRCDTDRCDVLYDEFAKYSGEPNLMLPRIQEIINQILQKCPQTGFDPWRGWLLARRTAYYKYVPDHDHHCKVTKYDEIYYLAPDGRFVIYTYEFEEGWNNKGARGYWYVEKDWQQQDIPWDKMAQVLDFHVYYKRTENFIRDGEDHEWLETSDSISKFYPRWERAVVKAERLYTKKGVGLYRLLCAVLNESEYYVRICAKINSRLDEIARKKQVRKDKHNQNVQKQEAMNNIQSPTKPAGLLERILSFFI